MTYTPEGVLESFVAGLISGRDESESAAEKAVKLFEELCTPGFRFPDQLEGSEYDDVLGAWVQIISEMRNTDEDREPHHTWQELEEATYIVTAHLVKNLEADDWRVEKFIEKIGFTPSDYLTDKNVK